MTTYAVTGTSGHLGRLVVESLLTRGVHPTAIIAIARTTSKVSDFADRGIEVRYGDYDDLSSLGSALAGADRVVMVSASEVGKRVPQHQNVIAAAERAGVARIVYTSLLKAETSTLGLAPEHVETERLLVESPIPATILRNSWYLENYSSQAATYAATGTVLGAADNAPITVGARSDYADAAAVAAMQESEGQIYELGGVAFTFDELAATVARVTGTDVVHRNVTALELAGILQESAGMVAGTAGFWASIDTAIARGDLHTDSTDLQDLIGRAPVSLEDAVRASLDSENDA